MKHQLMSSAYTFLFKWKLGGSKSQTVKIYVSIDDNNEGAL